MIYGQEMLKISIILKRANKQTNKQTNTYFPNTVFTCLSLQEPDNYVYLFSNYSLPPETYVQDYRVYSSLVKSFPEFSSAWLLGPSVTEPKNKAIRYYKRWPVGGFNAILVQLIMF